MKWIATILFFVAIVLLDYAYRFGLSQNLNLKSSYVLLKKNNATILFHGPCEPLWMLNPEQIDSITKIKSYNLALSHSDFADNYLHLYLYLKNNIPPKYLFLYVTPESFDKRFNTFNTYRFIHLMHDSVVKNTLIENDKNYNWLHIIPLLRYSYYGNNINFNVLQGWKHYLTSKKNPYFENGYEPPFKMIWDNHLNDLFKDYLNGIDFKWDSLREKYLIKIIQLTQQNNIKLYLYESPVLFESLAYQRNRNAFIQKTKILAQKNNISYLVFDTMQIARNKNYYFSVLNLNTNGSRIFNTTFAKYISNYILSKDSLYR